MWRATGDLSGSILFVHVLYLTYTVALNLNLKRYNNRHSLTLTAAGNLQTQLLGQRNALSRKCFAQQDAIKREVTLLRSPSRTANYDVVVMPPLLATTQSPIALERICTQSYPSPLGDISRIWNTSRHPQDLSIYAHDTCNTLKSSFTRTYPMLRVHDNKSSPLLFESGTTTPTLTAGTGSPQQMFLPPPGAPPAQDSSTFNGES